MCAACVMGATTAAAGASGIRAWLATRRYSWLTPRRMGFVTVALLIVGVIAASVGFSAA